MTTGLERAPSKGSFGKASCGKDDFKCAASLSCNSSCAVATVNEISTPRKSRTIVRRFANTFPGIPCVAVTNERYMPCVFALVKDWGNWRMSSVIVDSTCSFAMASQARWNNFLPMVLFDAISLKSSRTALHFPAACSTLRMRSRGSTTCNPSLFSFRKVCSSIFSLENSAHKAVYASSN